MLATDTPWETLIGTAERILTELLAGPAPCFSVKSLAVNGRDILALGVEKGPAVGRILNELFAKVVDGTLPNQREALLEAASEMRGK